ncbi:hypothetical protein [Crassaminicella profunda]|uniref:hypothetical protein n=1 Tax=Crassaminicella profunda TaxID=1286698 RepID=UPI001CA76F7D|nr:hypothetical protein [Crassaminicella profunda]QZY55071.1 hypothetical protein K7H06_19045 [Crassaminicella profunda]
MNEEQYMKSIVDIPKEVYMEKFTPMEERVKGTDIEEGFKKLKEKIGDKDFEKYFNGLIKIKKHEKDMMIITPRESHRSIIMREYFDLLKEIFNVTNIIMVAQAI